MLLRRPWVFHGLSGLIIFLIFFVVRLRHLTLYNDPSQPQVFSTFSAFLALADALEHGRFGMVDVARLTEYSRLTPFADYRSVSAVGPSQYVPYYTIDIGYMFIVYLAQKLFPFLPHSYVPALALQVLTDGLVCGVLYWGFLRWSGAAAVGAGLLYASSKPAAYLSAVAFYYYWDIPAALLVLSLLYGFAVALDRGRGALAMLCSIVLFCVLGFAVWLRSTWWLLAVLTIGLLLTRVRRRQAWIALAVGLAVFVGLAAPQVYRSSAARGHLALSTRASWHVALVGFGAFPNPYGIDEGDNWAFELSRQKHGVPAVYNDYRQHDSAIRQDYVHILSSDPWFVVGSWARRVVDGLLARSVRARGWPLELVFALSIVGAVGLWVAGGSRRFLAIVLMAFYGAATLITSIVFYVNANYFGVQLAVLVVLATVGIHQFVSARGLVPKDRWAAAIAMTAPRTAFRAYARDPGRGHMVIGFAVGLVCLTGGLLYVAKVSSEKEPRWELLAELPAAVADRIKDLGDVSVAHQRGYLQQVGHHHGHAHVLSDGRAAVHTLAPRGLAAIARQDANGQEPIIVSRDVSDSLLKVLRDLRRFVSPSEIKRISGLRLDDRRSYGGTVITVEPYEGRSADDLLKPAVVYVDYRSDRQTGRHHREEKIRRHEALVRAGLAKLSLATIAKFEKQGFAWGGFDNDEDVHIFYFHPDGCAGPLECQSGGQR